MKNWLIKKILKSSMFRINSLSLAYFLLSNKTLSKNRRRPLEFAGIVSAEAVAVTVGVAEGIGVAEMLIVMNVDSALPLNLLSY